MLDYYGAGVISEVDAIGSPARILESILENVVPFQESHFENPVDDDA